MTLYAHVSGSTVDTVSTLPRLYFDGTDWHDWRQESQPWRTQPSSAGWFPVATTQRPVDTDTTTHDESVTLVDGLPVQTWTPRPWTVDEVAARAAQAAAEAKAAEDRAILDAIAHTSATAHVDGQPWTQPTGAHDAYALGATVTLGGKTWVSLIPANVWQPGVSGWREVVAEGPAEWVQPTGGHDAYPLGAQVTRNGRTWTSTVAANVWEPGVYGWV